MAGTSQTANASSTNNAALLVVERLVIVLGQSYTLQGWR